MCECANPTIVGVRVEVDSTYIGSVNGQTLPAIMPISQFLIEFDNYRIFKNKSMGSYLCTISFGKDIDSSKGNSLGLTDSTGATITPISLAPIGMSAELGECRNGFVGGRPPRPVSH